MKWNNAITALPQFQAAVRRINQIECLLIAVEFASDQMDITVMEGAISGIRALAGFAGSDLERVQEFENESRGGQA